MDLQTTPNDSLETEIMALRRYIRQVLSMADDLDELDQAGRIDHAIRLLRAVSAGYARLGMLLKIQKDLKGPDGGLNADLQRALQEVSRELGLTKDR
jgi:hypothetical protein